MATNNKQRETFDCIQWDGLKETALAFFGMDVLDKGLKDSKYFYDESNAALLEQSPYESVPIPNGWWLIKKESGEVYSMCEGQFNDQYDIIDEYPS